VLERVVSDAAGQHWGVVVGPVSVHVVRTSEAARKAVGHSVAIENATGAFRMRVIGRGLER
jgi:hypothetical protein